MPFVRWKRRSRPQQCKTCLTIPARSKRCEKEDRSVMFKSRSSRVALALLSGALVALAGLAGSYVVPLDHDAIQYATRPVNDPVAKLQQGMAAGEVTLDFDENTGYLPAVLKALNVPRESQVLVFSKTSFQAPRIYTRVPRAIYFNDS